MLTYIPVKSLRFLMFDVVDAVFVAVKIAPDSEHLDTLGYVFTSRHYTSHHRGIAVPSLWVPSICLTQDLPCLINTKRRDTEKIPIQRSLLREQLNSIIEKLPPEKGYFKYDNEISMPATYPLDKYNVLAASLYPIGDLVAIPVEDWPEVLI